MPRVISLIASATEIVCALGYEDFLVGRSHECDYPVSVQKLPICTEPAFNIDGSSLEIDQRVKEKLHEGLSLYQVHEDVLRELKPDIIITQSHCEVCAVSAKDVEKALCERLDFNPKIVSLTPNGLSDIWHGTQIIADALLEQEKGRVLIQNLKSRMFEISEKASRIKAKPTVACIEWIDPLMAAGNWVPELVERAGGINLFGKAGEHSPWMDFKGLSEKNPDVILVIPCGWGVERTKKEMAVLTQKPDWPLLKAVEKGRVYLADGNQFFNRPGPRVVESLEILAEILYPGMFHFGHEGKNWQVFNLENLSTAKYE